MSKNKKEKKIYIDDGSSIADMSMLGKSSSSKRSLHETKYSNNHRPTFKECFKTYIETVKLMLIPMLITIGIISIAFLLVYLIL